MLIDEKPKKRVPIQGMLTHAGHASFVSWGRQSEAIEGKQAQEEQARQEKALKEPKTKGKLYGGDNQEAVPFCQNRKDKCPMLFAYMYFCSYTEIHEYLRALKSVPGEESSQKTKEAGH